MLGMPTHILMTVVSLIPAYYVCHHNGIFRAAKPKACYAASNGLNAYSSSNRQTLPTGKLADGKSWPKTNCDIEYFQNPFLAFELNIFDEVPTLKKAFENRYLRALPDEGVISTSNSNHWGAMKCRILNVENNNRPLNLRFHVGWLAYCWLHTHTHTHYSVFNLNFHWLILNFSTEYPTKILNYW